MNPGGLFKVLLGTAVVLAILFFYISQQQQAQSDSMEADFARFDEDFARMNKQMSSSTDKDEWVKAEQAAHERVEASAQRAKDSQKKVDETLSEMEREIESINLEELSSE